MNKIILFNKIRAFCSIIRRSLGYIWTLNCPLCGTLLNKNESPICFKCLADLPRIRHDYEMPYIGVPGNVIIMKSWFIYDKNDLSRRLIHAIKYYDLPKLARKLGREYALQKLEDYKDIELIVPIPLHWTKYASRTYNQTREIARGIRDVTGIKVSRNLYAAHSHETQTRLTREGRVENVKGIFRVLCPKKFDGKHIALLDDVITSGATMFSALETILEVSKPASVTFLSLARTQLL